MVGILSDADFPPSKSPPPDPRCRNCWPLPCVGLPWLPPSADPRLLGEWRLVKTQPPAPPELPRKQLPRQPVYEELVRVVGEKQALETFCEVYGEKFKRQIGHERPGPRRGPSLLERYDRLKVSRGTIRAIHEIAKDLGISDALVKRRLAHERKRWRERERGGILGP